MLFITGQKPILKSKQGAFQIVDIVKLFHNVTKFCKQVRPRGQCNLKHGCPRASHPAPSRTVLKACRPPRHG